jgi:hypothetical protein
MEELIPIGKPKAKKAKLTARKKMLKKFIENKNNEIFERFSPDSLITTETNA